MNYIKLYIFETELIAELNERPILHLMIARKLFEKLGSCNHSPLVLNILEIGL